MDDVADKLIDAVPYVDGSGRRRLVAGVLFLTGLWAVNLDSTGGWARRLLLGTELPDLVKSPLLIGVAFVLAYAVGNFIELVGDIVIAPIACGVIGEIETAWLRSGWLGLPFALVVGVSKGFVVRGQLQFEYSRFVSPSTKERFDIDPLPDGVAAGLRYPLGAHSELAFKYLVDSFKVDRSRRWASQTIARVKDVSTLITVAVILLAILGIPRVVAIVTAEHPPPEFIESARLYREVIRDTMKKVNQQINEGDVRRCGSVCTSVKHIQDTVRNFVLYQTDVTAFADNVQIGIVELKSLNQRSRDLKGTVGDMNARVKDFSKLGSTSMQQDERLCREIAEIGRDLFRALSAGPSAPAKRSPAPINDVPIEGLQALQGRLDEIEKKTVCPTDWWRLIDTINELAHFLDPLEPAVIDPIILQGEKLVQSVSVAEHEGSRWSITWKVTIYLLFASIGLLPFYLVLVRSLRRGLTNILEALAIERKEGGPSEADAALKQHST